MPAVTWVKVVGFTDAERNSLNTVFRLSDRLVPCYALWSPDRPAQPHIMLVDTDSYEGTMELESPRLNSKLKLICVGHKPHGAAWRHYARPVDWSALVKSMDQLFMPPLHLDFDLNVEAETAPANLVPPGRKLVLLVGLARSDALYLRARFSLAGITEIDDVQSAAEASQRHLKKQYDLVVVSLELSDSDPWQLISSLNSDANATCSVIVATETPTWRAMERAEKLDCTGLLEIPFLPQQVLELIRRV